MLWDLSALRSPGPAHPCAAPPCASGTGCRSSWQRYRWRDRAVIVDPGKAPGPLYRRREPVPATNPCKWTSFEKTQAGCLGSPLNLVWPRLHWADPVAWPFFLKGSGLEPVCQELRQLESSMEQALENNWPPLRRQKKKWACLLVL